MSKVIGYCKRFRESVLNEIKLPDYTGRHLFTSKLRLVVFLACWVLVLVFFPFIWKVSPYSPVIFNCAFLVTAICYYNVFHGRWLFTSLVLELLADVISQTTVIYLLGGETNNFFLIYILYCITAGTFYGPRLSTLAAVIVVLCYGALLFLLHYDYIPPIIYGFGFQFKSAIHPDWAPLFYLTLTIIFIVIVMYAMRIANYFTRIKENALEERNQQLLALHRISSTIHNVAYLEPVIEQVLQGVIQGLGYDICLLALLKRTHGAEKGNAASQEFHFYAPKDHPVTRQASEKLGVPLNQLSLTAHPMTRNAIYSAIESRQIIFRNQLLELTLDLEPSISPAMAERAQLTMGWKKFIIIPLISEIKVIGALIGISKHTYVKEESVGVLEHFAVQVALAIESAYLFDELRQKNIELLEANRVKSEFLALMSHELRTPMHAILGFSELLADESMGAITLEQRGALKEIYNNASNLSELIDNVLDLAKMEAHKMDLSIAPFDFRETVEQVAYTLSPLMNEKHHSFLSHFDRPGPLMISADERKIRQILTNLLSNAIKFTPDAGKIDVYARSIPQEAMTAQSETRAWKYGDALYVEITDSGIGIAKESQRDLFQAFKQLDPSFTRRYQGTGLGLALCKQFIELHGGNIGVKSEEGNGSCFFFYIPMEPVLGIA